VEQAKQQVEQAEEEDTEDGSVKAVEEAKAVEAVEAGGAPATEVTVGAGANGLAEEAARPVAGKEEEAEAEGVSRE
jgi:hypothetical protein